MDADNLFFEDNKALKEEILKSHIFRENENRSISNTCINPIAFADLFQKQNFPVETTTKTKMPRLT